MIRIALGVFLVMVLTGCPDAPSNIPDAGPPPPPTGNNNTDAGPSFFEEVKPAFAAYCDYFARCGAATSKQDCEASLAASREQIDGYYRNALKDGRLKIKDIAPCIAELNVLACDLTLDPQGPCGSLIEGLVAANGACYQTEECVAGTYCDTSSTCPGTCLPRTGSGQSAPSYDSCREDLYRDESMVCREPAALSASCAPLSGNTSEQVCVNNAYCDVGQTCASQKPKDASCFGERECGGIYQCLASTCTEPLGEGATCTTSGSGACKIGLYCVGPSGSSGTCERLGTQGSACVYPEHCGGGLTCVSDFTNPGTCQPLGGASATCYQSFQCQNALWCDTRAGTPGQCMARLARSAQCDFTEQCAQSDHCKFDSGAGRSTCIARPKVGQPCAGGDYCEGGYCNGSICVAESGCVDPD